MTFRTSPDARAALDTIHSVELEGDELRYYHGELTRIAKDFDEGELSFADRILLDAIHDELTDIEAYFQEMNR